jgi:hypothetical protein
VTIDTLPLTFIFGFLAAYFTGPLIGRMGWAIGEEITSAAATGLD